MIVMWTSLVQFLTSLRLTLGLLLGIALVSIGGTVNPTVEGRFELFYQNFWFRGLLTLLALNLLACTLKTIRRNQQDRARCFEALRTDTSTGGTIKAGRGLTLARLRRSGYRIDEGVDGVVATRGCAGRWGSTVVHVAFLVIMAGALCAGFGFTGTLNLLAGDKSSVYFDWNRTEDLPLGFEFRLDRFEPVYYPIELQFSALEPGTGNVIDTYTTREGEMVQLPGGLSAKVVRYFFFEEDLVLELYRGATALGQYHALGGTRSWEKNPVVGIDFKPVAYRDPVVQQLVSEVSILERGQVVKKGVIRVNEPLEYNGVMIYQTTYNRDKFGFWSAGFQLSRDPGKPVVWLGCIALVVGLLLAFMVRYRVVGLVEQGGVCRLVPLAGFQGDAGTEAWQRLQRSLEEDEA